MQAERPLEYGVFIEGVFGVCHVCGAELTVEKDLQQAHLAEDDPTQVHLIWYHARCGDVMEHSLSLEDYRAAKSYLRCVGNPTELRVHGEAEVLLGKFRNLLDEVRSLAEIGWVTEYGHE